MTSNIVLQCPECKKPVHWNESSPCRPFCSARCQQLDFGAWASEDRFIKGRQANDKDVKDEDYNSEY